MARRRAALAVVTLVVALTLAPAGALAQGGSGTPLNQGGSSPLSPLTPQPVVPTTPTVTTVAPLTQTSGSGGGLTGTDGVLIGIGAVLVLGGISFFIWRDARRRAPVRQRPATAGADGGTGPRQRQKPRKLSPAERKRRKRGKAR